MNIIKFLIISTFLYFVSSESCTSNNDLSCWCEKNPYARQCRDRMDPTVKRGFLKVTLKAALIEAMKMRESAKVFHESSNDNTKENIAWSQCLNMYDIALIQLQQTLDDSNYHTDFDTQTWLSAVSTNILTCESGFAELGINIYGDEYQTNYPSFFSRKIMALIRNVLDINRDWSEEAITNYDNNNNNPRRGYFRTNNFKVSNRTRVVVAKDGSGNFGTITEAINALRGETRNGNTYVIRVKSGVYKENIVIPVGLENLVMVGDGIGKTIITSDLSRTRGFTLFGSATLAVYASRFMARGISIVNTAGPEGAQSVALASLSDFSIFFRCSIDGYQDTLFASSGKQFYRDCVISGTVDFIFGNAAAVFQNCNIYTKPNNGLYTNVITAQGRESSNENTGFSIQNSKITGIQNTYLGRPWKIYSRTAFINTYLGDNVSPAGWETYHDTSNLDKLCYREYQNYGVGSSTQNRVKWEGYRVMNEDEAKQYSLENLIDGLSWLPGSNVPYSLGP